VDVLIEGVSESLRDQGFKYLRNYFPDAPLHRIRHLMNGSILTFNPEALLYKELQPLDAVYLILSGSAELLRTGKRGSSLVSSGSILGETPALLGTAAVDTCRAVSFVQVLRLPRDLYLDLVTSGAERGDLVKALEQLDFLRGIWLFADNVSGVTLSRLVRSARPAAFGESQVIAPPADELLVIHEGEALLTTPTGYSERLRSGSHMGATTISGYESETTEIRFHVPTDALSFPLDAIADIPVVRWKLLEAHRRRYVDN
jgi:hemerythrin